MKPAALFALCLCACGGTFSIDDAGMLDASPDVTAADAAADASDGAATCTYAAGCCSSEGARQCVSGAAFDCETVDDAGTLGWVAADSGTCADADAGTFDPALLCVTEAGAVPCDLTGPWRCGAPDAGEFSCLTPGCAHGAACMVDGSPGTVQ